MTRCFCLLICVFALASNSFGQSTPQDQSNQNFRQDANSAPAAAPTDLSTLMQRSGGSLMRASLLIRQGPTDPSPIMNTSLIAVPKPKPHTIAKHDVITVIVNQQSQSTSNGSADLKRQQDLDAKLTNFIQLNPTALAVKSFAPTVPPELTFNSNREMQGTAAVERDDSFTTRIEAEVIDVKPNDTLVLQARQHIKMDDDEQTVTLTGICSVKDVDPTNAVLSSALYDLHLEKTTKGPVHDTTKRNLITKLLDLFNLF